MILGTLILYILNGLIFFFRFWSQHLSYNGYNIKLKQTIILGNIKMVVVKINNDGL